MVFEKVRCLFNITQIEDSDLPGYQVSLESVLTWIIRELRLHGQQEKEIDLSLKLDGRPFTGENISIYPISRFPYCILQ